MRKTLSVIIAGLALVLTAAPTAVAEPAPPADLPACYQTDIVHFFDEPWSVIEANCGVSFDEQQGPYVDGVEYLVTVWRDKVHKAYLQTEDELAAWQAAYDALNARTAERLAKVRGQRDAWHTKARHRLHRIRHLRSEVRELRAQLAAQD